MPWEGIYNLTILSCVIYALWLSPQDKADMERRADLFITRCFWLVAKHAFFGALFIGKHAFLAVVVIVKITFLAVLKLVWFLIKALALLFAIFVYLVVVPSY